MNSTTAATSTVATFLSTAAPSLLPTTTMMTPVPTTTSSAGAVAVRFLAQTAEVTPLQWGTTCAVVFGVLWFIGFAAVFLIYHRSYGEMVQRRNRRQASLASMLGSESPPVSPGGFGSSSMDGGNSPRSPIFLEDLQAASKSVDYTTISFNESGEPYKTKDVPRDISTKHASPMSASRTNHRRERSNSTNSDVHLLDQHRIELEKPPVVTTTRGGVSHAALFGSAPVLPPPPLPRRDSTAAPPHSSNMSSAGRIARNYFDDDDHLIPSPPPRPVAKPPPTHIHHQDAEGLEKRSSIRLDGRVFSSGDGGVTIRGVQRVEL